MLTPLERFSILSPSAITGDQKVHSAYRDLIRGRWLIESKFDQYLPCGVYGHDLDLILLQFYVEGSHHWFTIPEKIKIGRYSLKEKAITIKIPMLKDVSNAVLDNDVEKANQFLIETFTEVGRLINASKSIAKLDFDFVKFNKDYQIFMSHLLDDAPK